MERRNRPAYGGITPSATIEAPGIRMYSPIDYAGVLNSVPGVLLQSGAFNTNRISIRGIGARTPFGTDKLRLYYNGIPVTNGTGISVIEAFDLENLGQLEVVKGPYGTRYGSPLGGVLLLESMDVAEPGEHFTTRTTLGSYNLFKNHSRYRYLDEENQLAVSFNNLQSLGYRQNSQFDRTGLFAQGEHRLSPRSRIGFLLNYIDYFAQIPSSLNRTDYEERPEAAAANWLQARGYEENQYVLSGIYHKWYLGGSHILRSSVFYSYLDHYEARPFNILSDHTHSFGARAELYHQDEVLGYSLGLESYNDVYRWRTYENIVDEIGENGSSQGDILSRNREYRSYQTAFAQLSWNPRGRWQFLGAVTLNATDYAFRNFLGEAATEGSLSRSFDPLILPKFEAAYVLDHGRVFTRLGRGFSNPGLEEALTPEGVLNPDIEQEKGLSYEIGYQGEWKRWQLSVNAFQMEVRDLLVARRFTEDQFIGINAGETRHRGVEASVSGRLGKQGKSQWLPRIAYTFSDFTFTDFVDGDSDYGGNELPGVPANYLNGGLQWQHPAGFVLSWTHEYSDPVPLNDSNSDFADAYHLDRLQAGFRRTLPNGWMFGIDLGVNNLFDVQYARSFVVNAVGFGGDDPRFFYPGEPINFWGALSAGLRW